MVLREVLLLAAVALAISLPAAFGASKLVKAFLFGLEPHDPAALAGAAVTLLLAVTLAGFVPARTASLIDPMAALRHE
jgi:ABC-type antimicrobial peptide transport system permease subunit